MAWERIGSSTSPIVAKCQASSASRLLYDAEDLLQAVTTTLTVSLAMGKLVLSKLTSRLS